LFIICALFLCNYCNLPGHSSIKSYDGTFVKKTSCAESKGRTIIRTLDAVIFPYFLYLLYFFTRPKIKEQFKEEEE